MNEAEVLYFHAKLWDVARKWGANTEHHGNVIVFVCGPTKQNTHVMFREYFLSFTTSKITEKVELAKEATDKTSAILCRRYSNCLGTANLYSQTIKPSTKTCVFYKDSE